MTARLEANFAKRFSGGPTIHFEFSGLIKGHSITVLFGPSGCGKSTALRGLAGLERPETGVIRFAEEVWFDSTVRICRTPQQRGVGLLFQDYALFPHLTVAGNIGYGLKRDQPIAQMLELFGLAELARRFPNEISGGQQQRVALARVLVRQPRLVLLDEPLSALDESLRGELRVELRRLLARFDVPVILVTHDRSEALALGDRLIIMSEGRVHQSGHILEVFNRPANTTVARIVGMDTVQPGRVTEIVDGLAKVSVGDANLLAPPPGDSGAAVFACIRAEDVILQRGAAEASSVRNRLAGRILRLEREGAFVRVQLHVGFPLLARITALACEELTLREGDSITALVKAPAIHLISR